MKYAVLILIGLIAGCAQLMQGQEQPVIKKNSKEGIYYTTCSGAVETWASCYNKAQATCKNGYQVLNKDENSTGTKRELTFKCNK